MTLKRGGESFAEVLTSPQVRALEEASVKAGLSLAEVVTSVTKTLIDKRGASGNQLPEAEAAFFALHSGLEDPGRDGRADYARLAAEQAVRDLARFATTEQVAAMLGLDVSTVRHRAGARILETTKFGRELRYPLWQFVPGPDKAELLPHLTEIRAAIRQDVHPAEVAALMTTPQQSLTVHSEWVTPREWLRTGGAAEPVIELLESDYEW